MATNKFQGARHTHVMILACELEKSDREEEKITSIGGVFERLRLRISGDGEAQTGGVK